MRQRSENERAQGVNEGVVVVGVTRDRILQTPCLVRGVGTWGLLLCDASRARGS
jgi:hypothetical protein